MNKEEKLDGIKVGYTLEYTLYLYFTGLKPLELGFVLYEDRSVVKKGIIGLMTQDKFMDKIWGVVESYLKDEELSTKVIRNLNFKPHQFFNK
jgi:hypothetical protein